MEWLAIKAFLTSPLFMYLLIAALVCGGLYYVYSLGEANIQDKWDKEKLVVAAQIEKLKADQGKVTIKVETVYRDRVKTVIKKGDTITEFVDRFITKESDAKCVIPNNFVLLHDMAARNIVPTLTLTTTLAAPSAGGASK